MSHHRFNPSTSTSDRLPLYGMDCCSAPSGVAARYGRTAALAPSTESDTRVKEGNLIARARAGDLAKVRSLLERGANTEVTGIGDRTALHVAARAGYHEVVTALVAAGAEVQATDDFGRTPLLESVIGGHISVVTLLLMHGADPKACLDGKPGSELAAAMGHQELALILDIASRTNVVQVHRLVRWLASRPSHPSEAADRLMVRMLLHEKGVDARVAPLATVILQEIRRSTAPPSTPSGSPRSRYVRRSPAAAACQPERRVPRFVGVPPESISNKPSWILGGTDASVLGDEVHSLEDMASTVAVLDGDEWQVVSKADYTPIINRTVSELSRIANADGTLTALDEFNHYFAHLRTTTPLDPIQRVLTSALMLYSSDSFYRVLNDCWREGKSRALLGFSTLMSLAFRHARHYPGGEAYRGVDLADVEHYVPGLVFRWPFFVSASADSAIATQFGSTVVVIEIPPGANVRDISRFSPFPDEQEVLFPAYQVFEVLDADRDEIRLRVFHDSFFGTGWARNAGGEVLPIE